MPVMEALICESSINRFALKVMIEANIEDRPVSNGLDWEKLFKLAEDPDLDDIARGPIETAIANLYAPHSSYCWALIYIEVI